MRAEHASVKKGAHAIIWRCFAISSATSWWPVSMRCPVEKLEAYRTCSDSFGLACPAFAFCDLTRGFLLSNRVVHSRLNRFLGVIYDWLRLISDVHISSSTRTLLELSACSVGANLFLTAARASLVASIFLTAGISQRPIFTRCLDSSATMAE